MMARIDVDGWNRSKADYTAFLCLHQLQWLAGDDTLAFKLRTLHRCTDSLDEATSCISTASLPSVMHLDKQGLHYAHHRLLGNPHYASPFPCPICSISLNRYLGPVMHLLVCRS